jgi:hypothetical protein
MKAAICFAALLALSGCTSVLVRDEGIDLPPIPAELLVECPRPIEPSGPTFAEIYTNAIANAVGPWADCWRMQSQTVALIKYRDAAAAKLKADRAKAKPWWKFWGD